MHGFNPQSNSLQVNPNQKGNPVLKYIRNVHWQFINGREGDAMMPDYVLGNSTSAVFLSLRYHLLKPEYIHTRMRNVRTWGKTLGTIKSRILIVQVDTEDTQTALAQVTKAAIHNDFTLFCGFSAAECARYLETLKSYENKPAESIQKDLGSDYGSRATSVLTVIRGVNKTDAKTLLSSPSLVPDGSRDESSTISLADVFRSSLENLQKCPGIGPTKAKRFYEACHSPFFSAQMDTAQQSNGS
jgi:DNA excision repair protein ERCC-1